MDLGINFTQPWGLLALVLVPLAWQIGRRSIAALPRARRRLSHGVRSALIVLLVLALAGTQVVRAVDTLAVVFLLDRSDSVRPAQRAAAEDFVRRAVEGMSERDRAGVVVFGADALVDRPVSADRLLAEITSKPATTFSNLADSLRLGTALFPDDTQKRLVLLSDGNENLNSAEAAARLAAARGIPVQVVPLPVEPGREVLIGGLSAPAATREGEKFNLTINIQSTVNTTATLRLLADGQVLSEGPVALTGGAGGNTFAQPLLAGSKGFHTYRAEVIPIPGTDTRAENNQYSAYTLVAGKPRVLIVEGKAGEAASLQAALTAAGLDSDLTPPDRMPVDLTTLAQYEGVVLVNVPNPSLPKALQTAGPDNSLMTVVRDLGRGLVVIGGDESYGVGGYFRSALETMLPVSMDLPSKLEIPTVAMVLVIDRSGSMASEHGGSDTGSSGGSTTTSKIELAKEAAYNAVAQLSGRDYVGVVAFDSAANWVVPLQPLQDPLGLRDKIGSMSPGGGTYIYSGLAEAVDALEKNNARSKHIILLTDGQSEGGDYAGLLDRMDKAHITLSGVAVGQDADAALLQYLAAKGGGNYYFADASSLPQIFAHESHVAARSYIVEHPFTPKRTAPSPILQSIPETPQLLGYVGTTPKPNATTALVTDVGDPLLAHWQYGLGRVVAWTSDATGQWAKNWVGWDKFRDFWGAALRWSLGVEGGGTLQSRVELDGATAHVTVDAVDASGGYENQLQVGAVLVAPSRVTDTVTLPQTAPGHYEGTFPVREEGSYLVRVSATGPDLNTGQTVGLVVPYSPEYKVQPTDTGLLARLAAATNGQVLALDAADSPAAVFRHDLPPVRRAVDLWPWLLLAAILLLPLDIGLRRVMIGWRDLGRFWGELRGRVPALAGAGPAVPSDAEAQAAVGRLLDARRRAAPRLTRPPATEIAAQIAQPPPEPPPAARPGTPAPHSPPRTGDQLAGRTARATPASPPPAASEDEGNLAAKVFKLRQGRRE
jgi:Mg-chelatase subunit ChlD